MSETLQELKSRSYLRALAMLKSEPANEDQKLYFAEVRALPGPERMLLASCLAEVMQLESFRVCFEEFIPTLRASLAEVTSHKPPPLPKANTNDHYHADRLWQANLALKSLYEDFPECDIFPCLNIRHGGLYGFQTGLLPKLDRDAFAMTDTKLGYRPGSTEECFYSAVSFGCSFLQRRIWDEPLEEKGKHTLKRSWELISAMLVPWAGGDMRKRFDRESAKLSYFAEATRPTPLEVAVVSPAESSMGSSVELG